MIKKKILKSRVFVFIYITIISFFAFNFDIFAVESNYYETENPYRAKLQENYDITDENYKHQELDLSKAHKVYLKRRDDILIAEAKDSDTTEIKKKEEEQKKDRKEPTENKDLPDATKETTKLEEKPKDEKHWIDDWIVKTDKKPYDIVGSYNSIKIAMIIPFDNEFSATETMRFGDNEQKSKLFTGKSKNGFMPAVYYAVGNDKWKWFRWEVEMGYIPFRSAGFSYSVHSNVANTVDGFDLNKKQFSVHILTFGLNGFLQLGFFSGKVVGFIGLGLGVGYGWSWDRDLSGDFILPTTKASLGFSILVRDKGKLNISYNISYMQITMPSKYQFTRIVNGVKQQKQAIYNGSLNLGDIIIQGIQFEYQFYV